MIKYQSCLRAAAASNKHGKAAEALQGRQPTTVTHARMNETFSHNVIKSHDIGVFLNLYF